MENKQPISEIQEIVSSHFVIDDSIINENSDVFGIEFHGHLKNSDIERGFDALLSDLEKINNFAFINNLDGKQRLQVFPSREKRPKRRVSLNLVLFFLTVLSVLFTGGLYSFQGELSGNTLQDILTLIQNGWPFAVSLLAILAGHEFGHYFAGKRHGVDVTLPMFIPFPLSSFGTMGAFISMRSIPKTRKQLFDIAVSGPLVGLVISIIVLLIGLNLSKVSTLPLASDDFIGLQMEGSSFLYLFLKFISFKKILPNPVNLSGTPLLIFWMQYFFTGLPFPWGAQDVMLHSVAWAGWAGLFVTTINLLPVGQLDGGHIFQTVFNRKVIRFIFPLVMAILVIFGFFWNGWWTWVAILFFFGQLYAEPLNQITPLDKKRKWLGYFMVLVFLITFIPVPITIAGI